MTGEKIMKHKDLVKHFEGYDLLQIPAPQKFGDRFIVSLKQAFVYGVICRRYTNYPFRLIDLAKITGFDQSRTLRQYLKLFCERKLIKKDDFHAFYTRSPWTSGCELSFNQIFPRKHYFNDETDFQWERYFWIALPKLVNGERPKYDFYQQLMLVQDASYPDRPDAYWAKVLAIDSATVAKARNKKTQIKNIPDKDKIDNLCISIDFHGYENIDMIKSFCTKMARFQELQIQEIFDVFCQEYGNTTALTDAMIYFFRNHKNCTYRSKDIGKICQCIRKLGDLDSEEGFFLSNEYLRNLGEDMNGNNLHVSLD
jgi:hypothetical protein